MRGDIVIGIVVSILALLGIAGGVTAVLLQKDNYTDKTPEYSIRVNNPDGIDFNLRKFDRCLELNWKNDLSKRKWVTFKSLEEYITVLHKNLTLDLRPNVFDVQTKCGENAKELCTVKCNGATTRNTIILNIKAYECDLLLHELKHWIRLYQNEDPDYFHKDMEMWAKQTKTILP